MDFQIGTVKKTQGQVKKHASQCNAKELDQLENALNRVQCLVVSLLSGKIITSYLNKASDRHETLDLRRYNKNLKINLPKHLTN